MPRETEDFKDGFIEALMQTGKTEHEAEKSWEEYLSTTVTKTVILGVIGDLVADFMYYDRKEDEDLPMNAIEKAVAGGVITYDEMAAEFAKRIKKSA